MKARPRSLRVLGIMTGTSCDGLDAACIEIDTNGWVPLWSASIAYPAPLRKRVLNAQKPGSMQSALGWLELDRDLGEWFASSLTKILGSKKNKPTPHVIANHGQTIAHFPLAGVSAQMGDPTRIARATGISVISSFRQGDLAAGGQGAPLTPLFHALLAHHLDPDNGGVAIHNIGGISNLSYIHSGKTLAFDTGPGNIWIDAATETATAGRLKMDKNGKLASSGVIDVEGVKRILTHPYFKKAAPKSTGRDDFPFKLLLSCTRAKGADLVATATAVTVESMARAYESAILKKKQPLQAIYFCGGGAKNPALLGWMRDRLSQVRISTLDDCGLDSQLVEAQAFAYFGFLSLLGQPLGGPWTGAKRFGSPGLITPGENWNEVMSKLHEIRSHS